MDTTIHQSQPVHPPDICHLPDDPPQNVDKSCHLSGSVSTITNLDVTCTLDTACDQLLHLDPPSHSSDPQDISSVEIEFLSEFEGQLDHANLSPADVFHEHHDYDLFLLNQEIDTPSDNLNSQNTHVCENLDDILIHATNLSHTFALPQFMAQHNYEYLDPTDNPSTVPTDIQLLGITLSILGVLITNGNSVQSISVIHGTNQL